MLPKIALPIFCNFLDLFNLCVHGVPGLVLQRVQLGPEKYAPRCDSLALFQGHHVYLHALSGNTECVEDLDERSTMIIFESILTIFESSINLKAAGQYWKLALAYDL